MEVHIFYGNFYWSTYSYWNYGLPGEQVLKKVEVWANRSQDVPGISWPHESLGWRAALAPANLHLVASSPRPPDQTEPPFWGSKPYGGVLERRIPQNGWLIMENPIKMDDLGVPPFQETSICDPLHPAWSLGGKAQYLGQRIVEPC